LRKNEDLDPDPQIFHTLDPDPYPQIFQTLYPDLYEMDADSKRCPKTAEPDAKHRKFTTFFRFPGWNVHAFFFKEAGSRLIISDPDPTCQVNGSYWSGYYG